MLNKAEIRDLAKEIAWIARRDMLNEAEFQALAKESVWQKYIFGRTITKEEVVAWAKYVRDILDGTNVNTEYGRDYAQTIDNSEDARSQFDEYIETKLFQSIIN